jgi:hypothetical protein
VESKQASASFLKKRSKKLLLLFGRPAAFGQPRRHCERSEAIQSFAPQIRKKPNDPFSRHHPRTGTQKFFASFFQKRSACFS